MILNIDTRLWKTFLPVLLALALVLAACGGAASPEAPTEAPAAEEPAAEEPAPEEPAAEEPMDEEPMDEMMGPAGTLRVAFQPIVQTDPALISSDSEVFVANHVYDYFVDVDENSNSVPRLATAWTQSTDGLTWTFTLAENVTFHDGSAFGAADVVWTYDRLRDPDLGFPTSTLYENIVSVEATGDLEVTFTLASPNPFFLYDLSDNHALVIKNGTDDASDFNGTGPFVVSNYSPEDRVEMVANENYFIEGRPHLAGLDVLFFNEDTAMVDALRGGQVDLVMRMSTSLFESLQSEAGIVTYDIPTNGFNGIRLRIDREPGNDPRILEAMKLSIDREAILAVVAQGYGAIAHDSPIGPLYGPFHDASVRAPARDVQAAIDLLTAAGYPDGIDLVLHVPDSGDRPDLATVLQQQWGEAGINVELSVEPESVYYGENGWLEVDLGITGWGSRPYPQFYLDIMLASGGIWNEAHFADAEFDALSTLAGTTLDDEERIEAYSQIQQLLAERGPIIIPYYFAQFGAINEAFNDGFAMKAFAGRTDVSHIVFTP